MRWHFAPLSVRLDHAARPPVGDGLGTVTRAAIIGCVSRTVATQTERYYDLILTGGESGMKNFFVSYNKHDRTWAEWIAWQLEEAGFSVVIQAWDFTGNWIEAMNRAMQESERTIAVLSPHYLEAVYTRSEWAEAFRRDPTGQLDLLVPVKVAPVKPTGILAQIVHVDLVGAADEADARERMLARAKRQRGKPSAAPSFPGSDQESRIVHQAVLRRPPYPALQEDTEQLRLARELLVRWRGQYAGRLAELRAIAKQTRKWSRARPEEFDDNIDHAIVVAAEVADALSLLPVSSLEFARAYGLQVHETVFWGQALSDAKHQRAMFDGPTRAVRARANELRAQHGLKGEESTPNSYGFEMLARVLESAAGMLEFDLSRLPRGFVAAPETPSATAAVTDLSGHDGLFMARVDNEACLRLMNASPKPATLGSFTARSLPLFTRCAQRNRDGTLDLVASDSEHLYYWAGSSPVPTGQHTGWSSILDARFLSDEAGAPAALVLSDGHVHTFGGDGSWKTLRRPEARLDLAGACLWIDPLDPTKRHLVSVTRSSHEVFSRALDGPHEVMRSGEELWEDPSFDAAFDGNLHWTGTEMTLATMQGLDCVVARCTADWGAGVQFLDPRTLATLRRPLALHGFVGDMTIAGGRWLVVAFLQDREPRRLGVWDLTSASDEPATLAYQERGDAYFPLVVAESDTAFRTVQVFRTRNLAPQPNRFELVAFEGPRGEARPLQIYDSLWLWAVHSSRAR